jgi:hypothetical protein
MLTVGPETVYPLEGAGTPPIVTLWPALKVDDPPESTLATTVWTPAAE